MMKTCLICKGIKPSDSFYGQQSYCKPCQNAYAKKWRQDNPDREKANKRRWQKSLTPRYNWNNHLMVRYGITAEQWEEKLAQQGGVCAICKKVDPRGRRLSVDHCHTTGQVRGLLCDRCNTLLGRVDDDRDILISAADYLSTYSMVSK